MFKAKIDFLLQLSSYNATFVVENFSEICVYKSAWGLCDWKMNSVYLLPSLIFYCYLHLDTYLNAAEYKKDFF